MQKKVAAHSLGPSFFPQKRQSAAAATRLCALAAVIPLPSAVAVPSCRHLGFQPIITAQVGFAVSGFCDPIRTPPSSHSV
ncbi:unnamed protein product [Urochloa humidicola]